MASTSQLREWWDFYCCDPTQFVYVELPGEGRSWSLPVAAESYGVWKAVADIMRTEPYLFRESAGGTYNCRPISGSNNMSLHSYGIALDLNPKANPQKTPLTYDYPQSFITRMEGIRASGKQALTWGGRWTSTTPDAMHWQIDVPPKDCAQVEWDGGDGGQMSWKKPGDPVQSLSDADAVLAYQGTFAPGQREASYNPGSDAELNDRIWVVLGRITDWSMQIDQRLRAGGL